MWLFACQVVCPEKFMLSLQHGREHLKIWRIDGFGTCPQRFGRQGLCAGILLPIVEKHPPLVTAPPPNPLFCFLPNGSIDEVQFSEVQCVFASIQKLPIFAIF